SKQVIVPPTKNFLTVDVKPDRPQYQPREEGTFSITTRDDNGKPVPAEIAFSLVDESVFYIQQDYAGDPRQFYFGTKRQQFVQTQSTMNQKSYIKLIKGENDQLMDERERDLSKRRRAGLQNEVELGLYDKDGVSPDLYFHANSPQAVDELSSAGGGGGGRLSAY